MIISYVLRIMLDPVKTSVSQIVFALTELRAASHQTVYSRWRAWPNLAFFQTKFLSI